MNKGTSNLNNSDLITKTDELHFENNKLVWLKPELKKIDAVTDTNAAKPSIVAFESSPGWGIS